MNSTVLFVFDRSTSSYDQIIPYVFSQKSHNKNREAFPSPSAFAFCLLISTYGAIVIARQNPTLSFCLVDYLIHCFLFVSVLC